jgi:membrane fusion protein (multidrug efflux system)
LFKQMGEKVLGKGEPDVSRQQVNGNNNSQIGNNGQEGGSAVESDAVDDHEGREEAPQSAVDAETEPEKNGKNGSRRRILYIGAIVLGIGVIVGFVYWLYARQFESTDDAFVEADITQVSPKVSAYVKTIHVSNNQFVRQGDLLVELDQSDLQVKLQQAEAQLETAKSQRDVALANAQLTTRTTVAGQKTARSNVESARNNVDQQRLASEARQSQITQAHAALHTAEANLAQAEAEVPGAESNLHLAQLEYNRRLNLFNRGDISQQNLDQANNALQNAQAALNAARKTVLAAQSRVDEANANVRTAEQTFRQSVAQVSLSQSQVGESQGRLQDANAAPERVEVSQTQVETAEAAIKAAEAVVEQAKLDLSYTKITAPEDGYVTRKTVEEGQLVQIGAPLMAISQSDDVWVVANFKETQLERMKPGQKVDIEIDAFPNEDFKGHVDSVQAGTGSRFSVLPAENATGNFVKVVQRVPVKIVFDEPPEKVKRLVPGMSVEPSVKVR